MTRTQAELTDRWDLQDLVIRYATCIDAKDVDGLDEVFTPNAHLSFEASGGPAGDYPTIRAWLAETLPLFAATQHLMANLAVRLDHATGPDDATGRCMCFNPMALEPTSEKDQRVMFYGLWYDLRFERTPAGWRISRLEQEQAFHHNLP